MRGSTMAAAALAVAWCLATALWAADRTYGDVAVSAVVGVYDGDTFKAMIAGWPPLVGDSISVRIAGINTPEVRGTRGRERTLAYKARLFTQNRLQRAHTVTLRNMRRDKYFRILADVYADSLDLGAELIRVGLAREYDGKGPKPRW
jgi:micrococcal nuclease